jgi:hypothetical protein
MTTLARVLGQQSRDGAYDALFRWILFAALMGLAAVISWDYGLLQYTFTADTSRISVLIAILFLGFWLHSLWIVLQLSRELRQTLVVEDALAATTGPLSVADGQIVALQGKLPKDGPVARFFRNVAAAPGAADRSLLLQSFSATLKRRTKVGVYGADVIYKLGMLGTMIGFVIMLNSMGDMKNFDVETLRSALQRMIGGMAVSLLTTITGLIGGLLLRVFYNLAEGQVSDILHGMVEMTETQLGPRLVPAAGVERDV